MRLFRNVKSSERGLIMSSKRCTLGSSSEIHTKLGSLRGKYESVKGKDTGVHAYLGVPFAKPPVGPALRLAAPGGLGRSERRHQATTDVRHFLYLNIYTPAKRPENAKLPVMVWIHGGGYVMGSASTYSGNCCQEDYTFFGPDPSAGGISVSLLLLSPLSEGLFHRAIAESGTAPTYALAKVTFLPFMTGVNNHEGSFLLAQVRGNLKTFCPRLRFLPCVYSNLCSPGAVWCFLPSMVFCDYFYAGAPVYLYGFQHSPSFLKDKRPSFVKSDHGDEIYSVFGYCFANIFILGACSEEDEQLNKIMMSYWGNFARTGSPNGQGLVHWPKYGEKEDYLAIDAKNQNVFQGLKKDKFVVLTQTPPENFKEQKDSRHTEF
uniref:Carboxylesterase type B domain-containing protein n=1 Tax=Takifugu rubripes TaxID=31033 RepID=A0A674MSD7_TAKRU